MTTYYTVDSGNYYSPGMVAMPITPSIQPIELHNMVTSLFPRGVSKHGDGYFLSASAIAGQISYSIDWGLEFYRRAMHPNAPSRYECIFACESLNGAMAFRAKYRNANVPIYEIEADDNLIHRGDMTLLNNSNSCLVYTYQIEHYWAGTTFNQQPFWEVLIPLPATIGSQVA
ncbi:TPA: DUF2441 domain-containing protein [Klebsiella variicola subsp. variicola]|uniref:DUF2441 domain-containing protein n=1 Tax=Klebsiella grimontii TaxID=2058152 RepID=UPI0023792201|nr:DUF2441 domain-containing protein [Klebsiella grimontii]WDQ09578.1 DUF2441 domain-containing protein [Klebsiella grimontii]HCI5632896.1 DUF2441 domain-containing protein [Klebsiella variicola subsp. variicola]